jgi:hypothetical protein
MTGGATTYLKIAFLSATCINVVAMDSVEAIMEFEGSSCNKYDSAASSSPNHPKLHRRWMVKTVVVMVGQWVG